MNREMNLLNIRTSFNNKAAVSQLINEMKTAKPQSALKIESERRPLAEDFQPGPYDVICARGKRAAKHAGNVRFREIIQKYKPSYANATNKVEKSLIVSEIVDAVRSYSPDGGFVKKFGNRYYEVGDSVAREKIGQCLRDQLHSKYKSSTKAKKNRRKELRAMKNETEVDVTTQVEPEVKRESFSCSPFPFPLLPLETQSSMALLQEFTSTSI